MEQDLIAELRRLLQEVITPDLEALMVKLEQIQQQMQLSERNILEVLAMFRAETEVLRAETAASHAELRAELEILRAQMENEQMGERSAANKPNRFVM